MGVVDLGGVVVDQTYFRGGNNWTSGMTLLHTLCHAKLTLHVLPVLMMQCYS